MPWQIVGGWGVHADALCALAGDNDQVVAWHQAQPPDQPSWVLGWSLGGVVATHYLDHPNVLGLMTLNTPGHFSQQVDMRLFARLQRRVQRDPAAAMQGFCDWLLPTVSRTWIDLQSLEPGLERLASSHAALHWQASRKPCEHWAGRHDPLFQDSSQTLLEASHELPFSHAEQVRQRMREFAGEL